MSKPVFVDDYAAIIQVLNSYNEGCKQAKSEIMKPAFADEATIFSVEDGKLTGGPISNLYSIIDTVFRPSPDARAVIARVDIVGTIASARVDTNDLSGFCFTDFFNLVKVNGRWTIFSKIYHTNDASGA